MTEDVIFAKDCPVLNSHGVNLDAVRENAKAQGVPLAEISVFYKDLTPNEIESLKEKDLLVSASESTVIGAFDSDGNVPFPDKVSGVYSLSS